MRPSLRFFIVAIAVLCAVMFSVSYHSAQAAFTIDGTMGETEWVSLGTSVGGPTPGFGAGHEINALYVYNDFNYLYVGVAGNVQDGNQIVVLMDTRSGGYSDGNFGRSGAPQGLDNFNSSTTFDSGFLPDYALVIGTNGAHDNYFWDLYTLSGTFGSGGGPNNYLGDNVSADLQGDPLNSSTTRGFESRITYNTTGTGVALQITNAAPKFFAFYIGDSGFLSNQFISRANNTDGNYTNGAVNFGAAAPNPVEFSAGDIQWNGLRHDTFDVYYRSPFGAVTTSTLVTLRFRTTPLDVDRVSLRVYQYNPATQTTSGPTDYPMVYLEDRVENSVNYAIWTYTLNTPSSPAILYYKFRVGDRFDEDYYSDSYVDDHDNLNQGGEGAASDDETDKSFQLTVYASDFTTPAWLHNAVVMQIFPDRFRNGDITNDYCRAGATTGCPSFYGDPINTPAQNIHTTWNELICDPRPATPCLNKYGTQFFGGDLEGIEDKLDYLQNLGVNTLYLTPIFKARSNHRYDADDYMEIDDALGGQSAFDSLITAMNARGMKLILDGVFNHTSSDSLYFDRYHRYAGDGACESTSSTYRPWFVFLNPNTPCGTGDYAGWFGYDSLAVLTDNNAAVRDYIYRTSGNNVVQHWYDEGAGGWRFDVADEITHDWWRDFRSYAKAFKSDGPLIGEVWYDATPFLLGDQLDSVMNYRFRKNILGFARGVQWNDNDNNGSNNIIALSPSQFDHALRSVREDYPLPATLAMLNLIDSHDTNRALYVLTLVGDSGLTQAKERLKLTALFQFTYLGAPMIYYGDEAAINSPSLANGSNGPEDDPYNRAPYPWADESGSTSVYGPADADMIAYYAKLAQVRSLHASLRTGTIETLLTGDTSASATDNNTYAFARTGSSETGIVVLNNGTTDNTAQVPVSAYFADGTILYDALTNNPYPVAAGVVTVAPGAREGLVLFSSPTPTAVELANLTARAKAQGVQLLWQTGNELNTVGFNIQRRLNGGEWKQINDALVPAANPGGLAGTEYRRIDKLAESGSYAYRIEIVGTAGSQFSQAVGVDVTIPDCLPLAATESPAAGSGVQTRRVILSWTAPACVSSWQVILREGSKRGMLVERVNDLAQPEYRTKRLERGKTYFWRVVGCKDEVCKRSAWSFFRIK